MPESITALRVFIASPSGMEDARDRVLQTIHEYNERSAVGSGVVFLPVRWEGIPGGVGRAQGLINQHLRESDYMVLLLHDRWGSPTGEYSSGIEEEFWTAVECLQSESMPLKDVLILFQSISTDRLRDPGPQLSKVISFRRRLEGGRGFFFHEFHDDHSLVHKLNGALGNWSHGDQTARSVDVELAQDVEPSDPESADIDWVLSRASSLEEKGMLTQAELLYAKASADGHIDALRQYARFMRRRGRLESSYKMNQQILSAGSEGDISSLVANSETLANMGLIRRKQGRHLDARELLIESVRTAREAGSEGRRALAYALDHLGLVERRIGNLQEAESCHAEAAQLHACANDPLGEAHSLRHQSALRLALGDLDGAWSLATDALICAEGIADVRIHAAINAQLGQLAHRRGDNPEARRYVQEAFDLNRKVGSPDGMAMNSIQLGRLSLDERNWAEADSKAREALQYFVRSDNREGIASATQLAGRVALAKGALDEAQSSLSDAVEQFVAMNDRPSEGWARLYLSDALACLGLAEEERRQLEAATIVANELGLTSLGDKIAERKVKNAS